MHRVLIKCLALIATVIFGFVKSPKANGPTCESDKKGQIMEIDIILSPVTRFVSCSSEQRHATAIKLASMTATSENSQPQCLVNSMNTLNAEHRFRRI